jgi:cytidylate kinase
MEKRIVVAIDGPAGAGKSTVARQVAERMGFLYIDTGAMYRAVALWAGRQGTAYDDQLNLTQLAIAADIDLRPEGVFLNGEDVSRAIRTPEIAAAASQVAAVPGVRRALVEKQRAFGARQSVVMEGRDIATNVFPDAQVKIFLDASAEVRAHRRVAEAGGDPARVARDIADRDQRDRTRAEAPLLQAPDATYLDTSHLAPDAVVEEILRLIRARTSNGKAVTS